MVYPVYGLKFEFNTQGQATPGEWVQPADLETFEMTFDNGIEEWNPMEQEGWTRRLMTAKSASIALTGKRNIGDPGNDYLAGLALLNGTDTYGQVRTTFPDESILMMDCVISVTNMGTGASTDVGALEIEAQSDGKPTYTPAPTP